MNKKISLRHGEMLTGILYVAFPLLGFAVFYIAPFGITIQKTFSGGISGFNFVGLENYLRVLQSPTFRLAVGNTFKFIGVGVPILMVLSLCISLILNTRLKGADFFRSVYILPLVLPVASVILVFQILFENGGMINHMLVALGIPGIDFLHSKHMFWVLIILYVWKNLGYSIILMMSGLCAIPREYYEAVRVDGAGAVGQFRSITLPLMVPTFFFVMIISIINSFKAFREAFILGGSYPDDSIYMIQHFMNNNFDRLNYSRLSVSAVLTFMVIFIFVSFIFMLRKKAGDYEL
jgi:multiple sugar transport system permease protein